MVVIPETAIGLTAMAGENIASSIDEGGAAHTPGFQKGHREAFMWRRHDKPVTGTHGFPFVPLGNKAEMNDVVVKRNGHYLRAEQDQFVKTAGFVLPATEVIKHRGASFRFVDATDIKKKKLGYSVARAEAIRLNLPWRLNSDGNNWTFQRDAGKPFAEELAFRLAVKDQSLRQGEEAVPHAEINRPFIVSQWSKTRFVFN